MPSRKTKSNRWTPEALYVGELIDLKKVEDGLKRYSFLNRDHPLIFKFLEGKFVALTKFGVIILWNMDEASRRQILSELLPYIRAQRTAYPYTETIEIFIGETDRVTPKGVYVHELDVERIKIISYAIAQSVALERYEEDIERNLSDAESVITNLKTAGRFMLKERELLKQVGRALAVKQTAISHLSLFDKPEEVWESPELEKLYTLLSAEFDLSPRFNVLDKKIEFLSEASRMLMEILAERKSALLELIIIILIAIGLIPYLPDIFRAFSRP